MRSKDAGRMVEKLEKAYGDCTLFACLRSVFYYLTTIHIVSSFLVLYYVVRFVMYLVVIFEVSILVYRKLRPVLDGG
jgi:hypothetical protein